MENYNISIVRVQESDRNIVLFTTAEHNILKGVNFWQDLGKDSPMKDYLHPDEDLTEWVLKRLRLANEEWVNWSIICPDYDELIENIDIAIWGYIDHKNTPEQITLPKAQVTHLVHALQFLERHAKDNNLLWTEFDAITLRGLMQYPVTISVTPQQQENFCANHGVDFPKYEA